jgi:anthranilate phosphoribosyltransferase
MIREAISTVVSGTDLSRSEARDVMREIMRGEATQAQIGSFLTALRIKGETIDEIAGCAEAMKESAVRIRTKRDDLVDTCGTGGDGSGTFNVSTTVAFVAAGAGLAVAKHGNRSVSSQCGSADLLQALGVNLELGPVQVGQCIDEVGIGFLFAPLFHPAMKHAIGPRREIGLRTIFNVLGPLTNPAGARRQVLGVYDGSLTDALANALVALGCDHALVVHGADGLDELSTTGPSRIAEARNGTVNVYSLDPERFGLSRARVGDLSGGSGEDNAALTQALLDGERGPRRDIVLLNAAAVLVVGGKAKDISEGMAVAVEAIDSGAARRALDSLVEFSRSVGN